MQVRMFSSTFNAKPDIVIHTKYVAVCLEAKWESKVATYSAKGGEDGQCCIKLSQTDIQKYMFKELLRMETKFAFLTKKEPRETGGYKRLTWDKVFGEMNLDSAPKFIRCWVEHIKNECR